MQGEFSVFIDDRMPCVAAALVAHHHVILLRQQIHHPALSFIAPVDADDCCVAHSLSSFS